MNWVDMKRHLDTVLAVAPSYDPYLDRWVALELVRKPNDKHVWRDRVVPTENGNARLDVHETCEDLRRYVDDLNEQITVAGSDFSNSLRLKIEKAIQAKNRLFDEERLLESEASLRDKVKDTPSVDQLVLHADSEIYRQEVFEILLKLPSLSILTVGSRGHRYVLFKNADGSWSKPYFQNRKLAQTSYRARIANPFGLSARAHWGQTKSEIRKILLPRANELLQLAHVQRLLAEALAEGKKALVCNGMVFWYEEDGEIGWHVKEAAYGSGKEGQTIWLEGTIESRNHGRLVILPYIKSSGEKVKGHTRNAPHDGKAKPRHPDHYLDIPFEVLKGDLMIELMGHLPYD